MNIDHRLPIELIANFRLGGIQLPNGSQALDLFATVQTRADDPGQTRRLRLTPQMHADLILALSEAQTEQLGPGVVQRLFDTAQLEPVQMTDTGQTGFLLTLAQTNQSGNHALPVRLFVGQGQLLGLADLLAEAVAHHGLRPPSGPTTRQ